MASFQCPVCRQTHRVTGAVGLGPGRCRCGARYVVESRHGGEGVGSPEDPIGTMALEDAAGDRPRGSWFLGDDGTPYHVLFY